MIFFMKHFDKLIIRLYGQFTSKTTFYLRYSLESLKRQSCISNALAHLLFCNRFQILMMVIVDHVLDCLLMIKVILFPQLDITLFSYF